MHFNIISIDIALPMQSFKGQFSPSIFFKLPAATITIVVFIIYWISQYYKHQLPFPNCWISKCAQHYPEFVFFRIATISGSALMFLGWLTNHFYIKSICKEKVFNISPYRPEISLILGLMSTMLLMCNTATIDTGVMKTPWHVFFASKFFQFTILCQSYNTYIFTILHKKIGVINYPNLLLKYALAALVVIQLYISAKYGSTEGWFEFYGEDKELGNWVEKFLEWTLTATVVAGMYSMGVDVEGFRLIYQQNGKNEPSELELTTAE